MEDSGQRGRTRISRKILSGIILVLSAGAIAWWMFWPRPIARPDYLPRSVMLRAPEVLVYPPTPPLRGTIVFFGNDVGFWQPHQELADFLSRQGYAVVGYDLRDLLKSNVDRSIEERNTVIGDSIARLMSESLTEFHGERLPLVLMGHSLGAEVAIWAGAHIAQPRITGIVAMAPGGRGHLAITALDFLSSTLPKGPDSFRMADLVRSSSPRMRIAIVRGAHDGYGGADPEIVAAGPGRVQRFTIPLAGHSLKKILIARYVVEKALDWVLAINPAGQVASN